MIALSHQERLVLSIIQPIADDLGLDIVRVRVMGGKRPLLQIMIEKAGGLPTDVEDCARFSRDISPVLDVEDPISEAFRLEVSTPGIDRPLTRKGDFARWIGHLVKIELTVPIEGRRRFSGHIQREDAAGIAILLDDNTELVAELDEMAKASLVLTDALVADAQANGSAPVQPGEPGFESLDIETGADINAPHTDINLETAQSEEAKA